MNQIRSRMNALRRKTKTALRGELVQLPHLPTRRRSKDSRRLSGYVNELHDTCNSRPLSCHPRPQPVIPAPSLSFPRRRESSPRSQARIKRQ